MRKAYLRDLEAAGVPTVPTRFVEPSDRTSLQVLGRGGPRRGGVAGALRSGGRLRRGGVLRLMELELLEPGLFLATHPMAPARLAEAIARAPAQE